MACAMVVIIALFTMINQMTLAADLTCVVGPHHKAFPSPEPDMRADTACSRYSSLSCCAANTSHSIDQQGDRELYKLHWDDCGNISTSCERYLKAESCFFACDPYLGPWKGSKDLTLYAVPVCASYCDEWFDACKDVPICTRNWLTDFKEDNTTGEYHCSNQTCRTFTEWYQNGKGMCETIYGNSFQYDADNENCMVMTFTGNNPNANVTKDTNGATGVQQCQSSLFLAVLSYVLLQF
ncbi:riboflavin-binding protein-like [Corticium candelabrum]|uniref:riboflavin-binding protein-like n=1 Tax=Corticium candelabrum TaxID=121492 RepID=UPI002E26E951|nr:riboflavin-binding protein-like [Corticium candelabrum]